MNRNKIAVLIAVLFALPTFADIPPPLEKAIRKDEPADIWTYFALGADKADLESLDNYGRTVADLAVRRGTLKALRELHSQGADFFALSAGRNLIYVAVEANRLDSLNVLMELEPTLDVNAVEPKKQKTALHIAAGNDSTDLTSRLLELNANPNLKDKDGLTPMMDAIKKGSDRAIMILIGVTNPNIQANGRETALHMTAEAGEYHLVLALLKLRKADFNKRDLAGHFPLKLAIEEAYRLNSLGKSANRSFLSAAILVAYGAPLFDGAPQSLTHLASYQDKNRKEATAVVQLFAMRFNPYTDEIDNPKFDFLAELETAIAKKKTSTPEYTEDKEGKEEEKSK